MKFLSDAEVFGTAPKVKAKTASPAFLSDDEVFGPEVDAIDAEARRGPRVVDSLKAGLKSAAGNVGGLVDLVVGFANQGIGVGVETSARVIGSLAGEDPEHVRKSAAGLKHSVSENKFNIFSQPVKKLMTAFGYGEDYDEAAVNRAMAKVSEYAEKGAEGAAELSKGGLSKEDVMYLFDAATYGAGTAAVGVAGRGARARTVKKAEDTRLARERAEAEIAEADAAAKQAEFDAGEATREAARQKWQERYEAANASERSALDGQARWAKENLLERPQESVQRIEPSTKSVQDIPLVGVDKPTLQSALEKIRADKSFDLTAQEKIALRGFEKESRNIAIPPEVAMKMKGAIDPDLLTYMFGASWLGTGLYMAYKKWQAQDRQEEYFKDLEKQPPELSPEGTMLAAAENLALPGAVGAVAALRGKGSVGKLAKGSPEPGIKPKVEVPVGRLPEGETPAKAIEVPAAERGSIDPELLKTLGAASAGAGIGYATGALLDSEKPARDAALGALGATVLRFPAGRETLRDAVTDADKFIGLISTRIKNMSPRVHHGLITLEKNILSDTHKALAATDDFFVELNRTKNPELDRAILTNDPRVVERLVADNPKLREGWQAVQKVLTNLGEQLQSRGRLRSLKEGYFPRIVKDKEGLMNALGKEAREGIELKIFEAERSVGRKLTQLEESKLINSALQQYKPLAGQPGFAKRRGVEEITEELQPFYHTPTESFHTYVRNAVSDIEKSKFFGRHLAEVEKQGQSYINVDKSIGNIIADERTTGRLTGPQLKELEEMLRVRFGPGEQGAPSWAQDFKNYANMGLLGNVIAAGTQIGDTVINAYTQGLRGAIRGAAAAAGVKKVVDMRDFGLADHISEEFVSTRKSAKALNTIFKYSLFSGVDRFGKNANLNAALSRHQRLVKTDKGLADIERRYAESFGDDFPKLVDELRSGEVGPQTELLLFHELSRSQPISKIEVPQKYLENPRGRLLYMLKTFMLKQMDLVRRDAIGEMKKGNFAKGAKNLTELGLVLGVAGATSDMVKQFIMSGITGREMEMPEWSDIPMNALKTWGWSEYVLDKVKDGKPLEAVGGMAVPPVRIIDDLVRQDPKALRYIPLIGRLAYDATPEGEKAHAKAQRRKDKKNMTPEEWKAKLREERLRKQYQIRPMKGL